MYYKHTLFPEFRFYRSSNSKKKRQQKLAEKIAHINKKTFRQVGELFGQFVPGHLLKQTKTGSMSRRRIYSLENTFWAFLTQVLSADRGCKGVVRKMQSYASARGLKIPSSSTASYCTAREKLSHETLLAIFRHTSSQKTLKGDGLLNGRRVVVADGTGVSMPDTKANQLEWPQMSVAKPGCGFPLARICACFSLETSLLLSYEISNKHDHELTLLRRQWDVLVSGDIFLGDKGFCSYYHMAELLRKGVDSVISLARRTPVKEAKSLKVLSENDLLISWPRPKYAKNLSYSREEWKDLPTEFQLRQIHVINECPGFRTRSFYIITTLLDAEKYPADQIAQLYLKRWNVELNFRDIKTIMGMDILSCRTPEMIKKELLMFFIAYNCIRSMMEQAIKNERLSSREVSFKGSIQALQSWEPHMNKETMTIGNRMRLIKDLYSVISSSVIMLRPGRKEPRCVKRRPKNYQFLTAPRNTFKEIPHRNRYRAKTA